MNENETNNQEELRKKLHMEARQSKAVQSLQDALGSGIKSINWGVIGWGQGGSRLAEEFYQFGYPVCVGNTAKQDLTFINVPEENKLFLDFALGGAGKDLELGDEAIRSYQDEVMQLMQNTFGEDTNSIVVCIGGGGGCVSKDANVFTSFCGLETIETMVNRVTDTVNRPFMKHNENGQFLDVSDQNIFTYSVNDNGEFEEDQILQVWKWNVAKERAYTIKLRNGTEVTTSDSHPFKVFSNGRVVDVAAKDLKIDNLLFRPQLPSWPFKENKEVEGIELNEDISWLVGLILGDGSFVQNNGYSVRIYTDTIGTLEKAKSIIEGTFNLSNVKINKRENHYELNFNNKVVYHKLLALCGLEKGGNKSSTIKFSESVIKSSRESVLAAIGGYFDADGWSTKQNICFGTVSDDMSKQLVSLLHLLGVEASTSREEMQISYTRDTSTWQPFNMVRVSSDKFKLANELKRFVTNPKRLAMLESYRDDTPRRSIPIDREWLLVALKDLGLNFKIKDRKIEGVSLHDLVNSRSTSLTIDKIERLCDLVSQRGDSSSCYFEQFKTLKRVVRYLEPVIEHSNSQKDLPFYDFTVAKNNNYVAGENGMTVIHNTGSGGAPALIELVSQFGLPVVVLYTLPMQNEGVVTKSNAIKTLEQISKLAQSDVVSSLIIVDNSRIEEMYPSISAGHFWKVANFEIASTLHTFNTLSSCDTKYVALDPMDFAKIFTTGSCTIFGRMKMNLNVDDNGKLSMEDDEIANSITENLHKGMLAQGFDLTETIRAGVMLTGRDEILEQIPQININYAFAELNDLVDGADVFRGVYTDSDANNTLNVLSIFSGLGLPRERVSSLINESKQQMDQMQAKEGNRSRMNVFDTPSVSSEQDKYKQMNKKKSPFAKMTTKARGRG